MSSIETEPFEYAHNGVVVDAALVYCPVTARRARASLESFLAETLTP